MVDLPGKANTEKLLNYRKNQVRLLSSDWGTFLGLFWNSRDSKRRSVGSEQIEYSSLHRHLVVSSYLCIGKLKRLEPLTENIAYGFFNNVTSCSSGAKGFKSAIASVSCTGNCRSWNYSVLDGIMGEAVINSRWEAIWKFSYLRRVVQLHTRGISSVHCISPLIERRDNN